MRIEEVAESFALISELPCSPSAFAEEVRRQFPKVEAVAAKHSVGIYWSGSLDLELLRKTEVQNDGLAEGKSYRIPVCYEMGLDLAAASSTLGITSEELISHHISGPADCFAVGFCPGFGYCDAPSEKLHGLRRLPSPRPRLDPGMVGLTGRMTAVYPLARPGGWQLIGRTPLVLSDPGDGFFPIQPGDALHFFRIDEQEFGKLLGIRVEPAD